MTGIDVHMLRALCEARLYESIGQSGPLGVEAAAAVMVAVAVNAGLVGLRDTRDPTDLSTPSSLALAVVTETLRINARSTRDVRVLGVAVMAALEANGFVYAYPPPTPLSLTNGQRVVLRHAANGLSYEETGRILRRGARTVQTQLEKARAALSARNTTHAAVIATELGLLVEQGPARESTLRIAA